MSSFTKPPKLTRIASQLWRVDAGFEYHLGWLGSGFVIGIPAGWETDLASIPRALQRWWPPDGTYAHAALIHDYLYNTALGNKLLADVVFYDALATLGVRKWLRCAMFAAVVLFGRGRYYTK